MKAVLARPAVVLADRFVQVDFLPEGLPRVGAHARAQAPQRLGEVVRRRNALEDVAAGAALQGRFDQCAGTVEGDSGHPDRGYAVVGAAQNFSKAAVSSEAIASASRFSIWLRSSM